MATETPSPPNAHPLPPIHSVCLDTHPDGVARGDAHPIVLLHGWGKTLETLRPLGELLVSDSTKVYLLDLPGFGLSPLPYEATNEGGGWSTEDYATRVLTFLTETVKVPCTLVGHSFGGRISVRIAARHPNIVHSLVLMASHGIPRERTTKEKIRLTYIRYLSQLSKKIDSLLSLETFKKYFSPKFGSIDYKAAGELRKTLVKTVNEDLSDLARTIVAPTLLLWGENDTETPVSIAKKYRALIRNSSLFLFPNKGHEPYADVGSHLMAHYINTFLSQQLSSVEAKKVGNLPQG
jgi:pimeloyl-ACP methyl ester carboxylesterase